MMKKLNNVTSSEDDFFIKLLNGEMPFCASILSENNEPIEMQVSNVSFVINGIEHNILDEQLSISTNSIHGDKVNPSSATIEIPLRDGMGSNIGLTGNARIENEMKDHYLIKIIDDGKQLKASSMKGLYAIIRVCKQRNGDFDYIDILFGQKNIKEQKIGEEKNRPHISFYPTGNGKFIRLAGYKCSLEGKMNYDNETQLITPKEIIINIDGYDEKLIVKFSFNNLEKTAIIKKASFEDEKSNSR